jgi:hypothetical protein
MPQDAVALAALLVLLSVVATVRHRYTRHPREDADEQSPGDGGATPPDWGDS